MTVPSSYWALCCSANLLFTPGLVHALFHSPVLLPLPILCQPCGPIPSERALSEDQQSYLSEKEVSCFPLPLRMFPKPTRGTPVVWKKENRVWLQTDSPSCKTFLLRQGHLLAIQLSASRRHPITQVGIKPKCLTMAPCDLTLSMLTSPGTPVSLAELLHHIAFWLFLEHTYLSPPQGLCTCCRLCRVSA